MKLGISLNFDEFNDKVEVAGISDESLTGERNRRLSEIPAECSHVLQPGDIIEAVNLQTDIEEIQRELQTALNIHMKVARMKDFGAPAPQITVEPQWASAPRQVIGERQAAPALQLRGPDWKVFPAMEGYNGQESQGEYLPLK